MQNTRPTLKTLLFVILISISNSAGNGVNKSTGTPNFDDSPKKFMSFDEFKKKHVRKQHEILPDNMFRNVPLQKREDYERLHKLITIDTNNRMDIGNHLNKRLGTLENKYIDKSKWKLSLDIEDNNSPQKGIIQIDPLQQSPFIKKLI